MYRLALADGADGVLFIRLQYVGVGSPKKVKNILYTKNIMSTAEMTKLDVLLLKLQ